MLTVEGIAVTSKREFLIYIFVWTNSRNKQLIRTRITYDVSNIVQCTIINTKWQMEFFSLTEEDIGNIMYVVKLRRMHATMITMCKYKYYELKQQ